MKPPTPPPARNTASALDVLLDIELPVTLRFGKTQMLLGEVMALTSGSYIPFDAAPEDPVEVVVNGRVVARGEVVMAAGNYAVRLAEVASRRERMDSSAPPKEVE